MKTSRTDEGNEMRCCGCAYDLRGLAEHRCPECGRAFDPAKPETFLSAPASGRRELTFAVIALGLVAVPSAWSMMGIQRVFHFPDWIALIGPISMLAGTFLGVGVAYQSAHVLWQHHPWLERRFAHWFAVLVGGVLVSALTVGTLLYYTHAFLTRGR